jgi:hypothetical protein
MEEDEPKTSNRLKRGRFHREARRRGGRRGKSFKIFLSPPRLLASL